MALLEGLRPHCKDWLRASIRGRLGWVVHKDLDGPKADQSTFTQGPAEAAVAQGLLPGLARGLLGRSFLLGLVTRASERALLVGSFGFGGGHGRGFLLFDLLRTRSDLSVIGEAESNRDLPLVGGEPQPDLL